MARTRFSPPNAAPNLKAIRRGPNRDPATKLTADELEAEHQTVIGLAKLRAAALRLDMADQDMLARIRRRDPRLRHNEGADAVQRQYAMALKLGEADAAPFVDQVAEERRQRRGELL